MKRLEKMTSTNINSHKQAEQFYAIHKERPFFNDLVSLMVSGPVMIQVLEGENAIMKNREVMGATDPKEAAPGTIRADFASSIDENAVHGSDGPETAAEEPDEATESAEAESGEAAETAEEAPAEESGE